MNSAARTRTYRPSLRDAYLQWHPVSDEYRPLLREIVVVELAKWSAIPAIYDPVFESQFYVQLADGRRSPLLKKPLRWRHYLGEVDVRVYPEPGL